VQSNLNRSSSGSQKSDGARPIHELRNSINAMVTSNSCLMQCQFIPPEYRRFVRAVDANGTVARTLLDDLDKLIVEAQRAKDRE
jgi:hypothetical protein